MSNIVFTDSEVKKLRKNKYVRNVSNKSITYTDEFKEKVVFETENYKKFWENFGPVIKEGLCEGTIYNTEILKLTNKILEHRFVVKNILANVSVLNYTEGVNNVTECL